MKLRSRAEQDRLDRSIDRMARFCLYAGISAVIGIALYGMWVHTHPLPTYIDVARECDAREGWASHLDRNAKGDVIAVRCDRRRTWRL